jgi:hypothetical protein
LLVAFCGTLALITVVARADQGRGSIRAAGRPQPQPTHAAPERAAPARAAPERAAPERAAPERREEHAPPPRVEAPARRDWDEHDESARHFGGFGQGAPEHAIRGERFHDITRAHRELVFRNHHYWIDDAGVYYDVVPDGGYVVIQPPVGVVAPAPPAGATPIVVGPTAYYYLDGVFYVPQPGGFAVVNPPPGIVVPALPAGAQQVIINGAVVYQFNGFNYTPSLLDGVTAYTVTPA